MNRSLTFRLILGNAKKDFGVFLCFSIIITTYWLITQIPASWRVSYLKKIKKEINKWTIIWLNTLNFMILKPTLMWNRIVQKKKNFHFISRRMHQIRFNLCNFLTHQKCHLFALPLLITATSARGLLLTVLTFVQIVNSNFLCV